MKNIVYSDLYQFNFLSDVVASPDGKHAIFTRTRADEKKNGYVSEIWILDVATGAYKKLTNLGEERGGFWLDDNTVVFTGSRDKDADKKKSYWQKIAIDGGEADRWMVIDEKISMIKPLGEGKFVVTSSKNCEGTPEEKPNEAFEGRDLYVFDELPFWFNGRGVTNKLRTSLRIYDEATGEFNTLTPQYMNVGGVQLSPDKKYIAYSGTEYKDVLPRESGLYIYNIETGETKTIVPQQDKGVGSAFFMGEDKLFFTATPFEFSGMNPRYFTYDIASGEITELPFCDASPHGGAGADCNFGGGSAMKWVGEYLYFTQSEWGKGILVKMDVNGNITKVCDKDGTINCFDIAGDKVIMCAMRDMNLVEIFSLDLTTGEEKQLTTFNTAYMQEHNVVKPEYFTFKNSSGYELEGWVIKPLGYEPGKKYPGVLEMHGGPKVIFGGIFHHEMQCLANMGYFVFYTNPRGSDGRGEEFANITENLGYKDFDDFMEFTDEVIRRYPDLDENKIGICGGSYGGFMCNWMIGHTDRYAAAASQRSISNYFTKSLCTDIGFSHNMAQLGTDPWHDFDTVWEHSPLKNAPKAKTPTLFIQSDEDYRCWMSDAIQMFTALKLNGVDSKLCLFHGENHELSRSGKPENRISRLTEIGNWFEKYLK